MQWKKVGNLGAVIKDAAREGLDSQAVARQIQSVVAEKLKEMTIRLQIGEKRISQKKRDKRVHRNGRLERRVLSRSHQTKSKKHKATQRTRERSTSIRAISGGLPSLGKKR